MNSPRPGIDLSEILMADHFGRNIRRRGCSETRFQLVQHDDGHLALRFWEREFCFPDHWKEFHPYDAINCFVRVMLERHAPDLLDSYQPIED